MRKWRLPLTYQPKIEPVLLGTCRQTIRKGWKKDVGDLIRFFVWTDKPYRSKQIDLTDYEILVQVINCIISKDGITRFWPEGIRNPEYMPCFTPWTKCDCIAKKDGIIPPTGKALRKVLESVNGQIPEDGVKAQILRW